ncbi:hypothetical protein RMATCC62417_14561 [Rhizopus microsporus]|nr:hypothetical protein RMATCC62417_14561 [Rhizopus microsporus]
MFCDLHDSWGGHSSEECEKTKKLLAARGLSNRVNKPNSPLSKLHSSSSSGSAYSKTNVCRNYDQNVQYSPGHRRVCPHNKAKSVRAVRSTKIVPATTSSSDPDMMDTDELKVTDDDHSFTACKYGLNKSITTAENSCFSLLTLETIDTFALVDPGATISAIDYKYCVINKRNVKKINTNEYILLAASNIKIKRIGTTDKLSFTRSNKTYNHAFEVMSLSDNILISTGTDLMKILSVWFIWFIKATHVPTDDRDTNLPTPNDSPYATDAEKLQFKQAIQLFLHDNGKIPSDSFYTIPEFIIYLDTPIGLRPCLDPRLINALLLDGKFPLPHIDEIFEKLRGSFIFTTLDLRQAFHGFKVYEPHQVKTPFTFQVNLILNPDKFYFAQQAVYLLGFCVNAKGISLDPRKVCNALEWPAPKTGKDIQRFLGLYSYFRKLIPNIAQVSASLGKLRFASILDDLYTTDVQHAFTSLKKLLAEVPLLHNHDFNISFRVITNASNYGIGTCLYQVIDNQVCYVGFMARALTKSERNYSVTKRGLLAIVYALKKFHTYLWGNKFYLYTDHKALIYIHTQEILGSVLVNWLDVIYDYNFTIYHRSGIKNILPDALSRLFEIKQLLEEDNRQTEKQNNNNHAIRMFKPLESITPYETERKNLLETMHIKHEHCDSKALVDALHNGGLHWNNIKEDALKTAKQRSVCQKFNIATHGFHPLQLIYAENPMDHICIDITDPMSATSHSGNSYLLIIVDVFTRYCIYRRTMSAYS